jgi:hypothetical protein
LRDGVIAVITLIRITISDHIPRFPECSRPSEHANPRADRSVLPIKPGGAAMDLRGLMPETWDCIDCGLNTAPGCSTRCEMEAAFSVIARDPEQGIPQTFDDRTEVYMVKSTVWRAARMEEYDGCLCIGCLENRIGRELKPRDFMRDHEFNQLPGTERLRSRRGDPR